MAGRRRFSFQLILLIFQIGLFVRCYRVKRVIGGYQVECGTQPRVASLRNATSLQHLCGVTLLSADYAITAAHCVAGNVREYVIQLNNHCHLPGQPYPTADVLDIFIHDDYNRYTLDHDIAILKINLNLTEDDASELDLDENILPKSSFGISGACEVYGYGVTALQSSAVYDHLKVARVNLVSLDECIESLGPFVAPQYDSGMICAAGSNADSCQGDSGGPLLCGSGRYLEGIVSYGQSCAVHNLPSVFASVGAHRTWINTITAL